MSPPSCICQGVFGALLENRNAKRIHVEEEGLFFFMLEKKKIIIIIKNKEKKQKQKQLSFNY